MQAMIFGLTIPVLPLLLWKWYQKEKQQSVWEIIVRYVAYTLLTTLIATVAMAFVCQEGTSFWEKADQSVGFVLKYAVVELAAAFAVAAAEWLAVSKKIVVTVDWEQYRVSKPVQFVKKVICPLGIYLLAGFVILLNISLMFDHVLWGDEAFSANTAQKSMGGILQVLYYWDNHPPLHYYWLKLFGEIFGHTVPVYHLASLVPFVVGVVWAVTVLRKKSGDVPAAFFVMISGLASSCIEYNLEVRMYSLAFLAVMMCFYCAYRVLCGGKAAWVGMVLWALAAAYSHYYALAAVGILLFITGVAAYVRFRGKVWIKGVLALVLFILGYVPWMSYLFTATENVSNNWWMTDVLELKYSISMVMGSTGMSQIILPLFVVLLLVLLLAESSFFTGRKQEEKLQIQIHTPSLRGWSDETYAAVVGALTVAGTLIFAYLLCLVMGPVLAERYLYPLSAITFVVIVIETGRVLELLKGWDANLAKAGKWNKLAAVGKLVCLMILAVLLVIGVKNYRNYSNMSVVEEQKTMETLYLIGEPEEEVQMVTNGVKHLGWTVLYFYFPDNEVINGNYEEAETDKFWYFTPDYLSEEEIRGLASEGYSIAGYGEKQLAKYPFMLYYMEKTETVGSK